MYCLKSSTKWGSKAEGILPLKAGGKRCNKPLCGAVS
jgi:hypothetical protein